MIENFCVVTHRLLLLFHIPTHLDLIFVNVLVDRHFHLDRVVQEAGGGPFQVGPFPAAAPLPRPTFPLFSSSVQRCAT